MHNLTGAKVNKQQLQSQQQMNSLDNKVDNPISSLLASTGLKMSELARKIGVTPNYLYMIESGRRPFTAKLQRLIDAAFVSEHPASQVNKHPVTAQPKDVARLLDIIDRLVHIIENLSGERIDPGKLN